MPVSVLGWIWSNQRSNFDKVPWLVKPRQTQAKTKSKAPKKAPMQTRKKTKPTAQDFEDTTSSEDDSKDDETSSSDTDDEYITKTIKAKQAKRR